MKPLLHVSSRYPVSIGCCALVAPICKHPTNANGVILFDLRQNPAELADLSVAQIQQRLFVSQADLAEGTERIALKTVQLNKCPAIAPAQMLSTLPQERLEAFQLDGNLLRTHLKTLRSIQGLAEKLAEVFQNQTFDTPTDPDLMIYSGGFFSDSDKRSREQITRLSAVDLADRSFQFDDARLDEMLLRYKGRNFPDIFTEEEAERWEAYRVARLTDHKLSGLTLNDFFSSLQDRMSNPALNERDHFILQELQLYGESILPYD